MGQWGFTYRLIPSEADFRKLAARYNKLMYATLLFFWWIRVGDGKHPVIDSGISEMWKLSSRERMGHLAAMVGCSYVTACVVSLCVEATGPSQRIFEEEAMLLGFLTLAFFLINLFGFWGIIWLLVSPPVVLLGLKVSKRF